MCVCTKVCVFVSCVQKCVCFHQVNMVSKIARGAFGNVYRGSWLGTECAIKQIDVWSLQVECVLYRMCSR